MMSYGNDECYDAFEFVIFDRTSLIPGRLEFNKNSIEAHTAHLFRDTLHTHYQLKKFFNIDGTIKNSTQSDMNSHPNRLIPARYITSISILVVTVPIDTFIVIVL